MTVWLTVALAADHIRANDEAIIRGAIKAGELPASLYGKTQLRIKQEDLDAWLESRPYEPPDRTIA